MDFSANYTYSGKIYKATLVPMSCTIGVKPTMFVAILTRLVQVCHVKFTTNFLRITRAVLMSTLFFAHLSSLGY